MSALVETMFYVRETPWHGMGTKVLEAPTSSDAIKLAGLDWVVKPEPVYLSDGTVVPGTIANVRQTDRHIVGTVGERYKIVQNTEAFAFTDALLGEGVTYETAGSLEDGSCIWLLARMPEDVTILGDKVTPYMVFTTRHDGKGAVKVFMTPVRVVCNNTLNLALSKATRTWSAKHTESINVRMNEATRTLKMADSYMNATKDVFEKLHSVKLSDTQVVSLIDRLVPNNAEDKVRRLNNNEKIREDIKFRYFEAPDLKVMDRTGARFVHAVSDTVSHMIPLRNSKDFAEKNFLRTLDGNNQKMNTEIKILDTAVSILLAA